MLPWRAGDEAGTAAVEFALIAPILLLMLLSMMDGAFALYQRFQIDHLLRAGAEVAKSDPGVATVLARMQELAGTADISAKVVIATPTRYCLCAASPAVMPATAPNCATPCPDGSPPGAAYALAASLPYGSFASPNVIMYTISSTISIQVK